MVIASLLMLVSGGERTATMVLVQKKSPARVEIFLLSAVGRLPSSTIVPGFLRVLATDATKWPIQNENQSVGPYSGLIRAHKRPPIGVDRFGGS